MAEVTKVRYSQDRTINLGNYQSVKIGYGMTAELDDDDDPKKVAAWLKEQVEELVDGEADGWVDDVKQRNNRRRR